MTDARFLSNNSVTCEANRIKCKTLMQSSWAYKTLTIIEIGQGFALAGRLFTKKWKFLPFWGPRSHSRAPIGMKFCTAKRTHVPLGLAKFHMNQCNESPLQGENVDFGPLWGTVIRGLMRGMATLPQGNQELLVVTDKAGRPPGELAVNKSWNVIFSIQ